MWDKQFDKASWNGIGFHLLKTSEEHGKRLHVAELPYKDDPHIWVLGGKAVGYQFEAIFVGAESLTDAKAFQAELDKDPAGVLEHPYLGELDLVYQTSSISHISTKKGLVTVSLKFIKQGAAVVIPESTAKSINTYTLPVVAASTTQFAKKVETATPDQINDLKNQMTALLNKGRAIVNQINRPGTDISDVISQIRSSESLLSSLANSPLSVAQQLNVTIGSLVTTVNQSDLNDQPFVNLQPTHYANDLLRKVEQETTDPHLKVVTTMASLDMNRSIQQLSNSNSWPNNLLGVEAEIDLLVQRVNLRKTEASSAATYENYEQVTALDGLITALAKHQDRIRQIHNAINEQEIYSPTPALYLAQLNDCDHDQFTSLNHYSHPLFIKGKVMVPNG